MGTPTIVPTGLAEGRIHPAAHLSRNLRLASAAALVLGTGLAATSWLVYAEPDLTASYTLVATGAGRPDLSLALNVLAPPFWIASVAVYVFLGRVRSPRLAWTGGGLLVAGLTALGQYVTCGLVCASQACRAFPMYDAHPHQTLIGTCDVVHHIQVEVVGVLHGRLELPVLDRDGGTPRRTSARLHLDLPRWAADVIGEVSGRVTDRP